MARDGTMTRQRLLEAAAHLFARRGVDAVPIREINELAGQRNASALHYHFGSRDGLLTAIVEHHQAQVNEERQRLLEGATDLPSLVDALFAPLADRLQTPEGRDYLRLVPQVLDRDVPVHPALAGTFERLEVELEPLRPALRRERLRAMLLAAAVLLADRAARLEVGERLELGHRAFTRNLVSMATGMLAAEVPERA
jgi:TetR/AcrR family transcriptional regulator, regulator of cefoperazone and chloramphenicol sensitivity